MLLTVTKTSVILWPNNTAEKFICSDLLLLSEIYVSHKKVKNGGKWFAFESEWDEETEKVSETESKGSKK